MTDTNELEALKARLKKLEAAQSQAAPAAGWGGLFSLIGSVVALVPRWLVVAAGVVFVAWLGFDLYMNAQQKIAVTRKVVEESGLEAATAKASWGSLTSIVGHVLTRQGAPPVQAPQAQPQPLSNPIEAKGPKRRDPLNCLDLTCK